MDHRSITLTVLMLSSVLVCACSGAADPQRVPAVTPAPAPVTERANFINRVWRVSESSSVAPGTLYVFLSEGTLLITSPNSKPALGTWNQDGGILTMVEASIAYKVDILNLSAEEFRIRSNNPGGAVELRLVPAQ